MNQKFYSRIRKFATAYNFTIKTLGRGILITADNSDGFNLMINRLYKMRNIYVDHRNFHTKSVLVYDINEYMEMRESQDRKSRIVNFFFEEMRRNGRNPEKAKEAQKAFAESIGGIAEYNSIYA